MKKADFYDLMKSIPKCELHVHEEAVLSYDTIKKVYQRTTGKQMTDEELKQLFSYEDLPGFLDTFIKIQTFFTDINDFVFLFDDFEQYLNDNNIVYCETFFSPTSHLKKGWKFSQMIELITESIKKIKANSGRDVRLLIDVSRSFGEENAMNNLKLVLAEKSPYILGIGLGGNEAKGPAAEYKNVFQKAVENNIHVVAHAGEVCDSSSIKDSINLLKAERIGHGISAAKDAEFMKELAEKKIPLEVCPTSNTFMKEIGKDLKNHPIRQLYDNGVFVTLNTDDPTFFKVSLLDEYWNLYSKLNFTLDEIKQIVLNGFEASFADDEKKAYYKQQVEKAWKEWFEAHE